VVNPPRELWGTSRYSVPFLCNPVSMPLNCLENCIDAENPKQFEDILLVIIYTNVSRFLGLIKNNL
jgi:hypothetical protein